MNKRSVIIGAGGRLGGALCDACSPLHSVTKLRHKDLDLGNLTSIQAVLGDLDYDTLWLTAALTDVDYCESHPNQAKTVNAEAVKAIAQFSAEKGARVILFSTDYVFDGEKDDLYLEDDTTSPLNIYGQSKLKAENYALAASDRHLVIRLSWLFGPTRPGFPDWVIKQAMKTDSLSIVSDRRSSPTYTNDVIAALTPMIRGDLEMSGILHLSNQGVCTWQEWAQHCLDCATENDIPLQTGKVKSCLMSDIENFTARRPVFSALSTSRYESLTGQQMPNWKQAVSHYVREYLTQKLKKKG